MCRYEQWSDYKLTCGAVWNDTYTPTPFNFTTIDKFFDKQKAQTLKAKLTKVYEGRPTATVVEVLENEDDDIRAYAQYLFDNDYAPYTAKAVGAYLPLRLTRLCLKEYLCVFHMTRDISTTLIR